MSTTTRRDVLLGTAALAPLAASRAGAAPSRRRCTASASSPRASRASRNRGTGTRGTSPSTSTRTSDLDAIKKYLDPGSAEMFRKYTRNPKFTFDQLPFADTKITHYYDADPSAIRPFLEAFPGVKAAKSLEEMVEEVDAVWLGDACGFGEDHFDLIAPALRAGCPRSATSRSAARSRARRRFWSSPRSTTRRSCRAVCSDTIRGWRRRSASATRTSSGRSAT